MTLEEAIKNEEEAVEGNEKLAEFYYKEPGRNTALGNACRELADERRQLAEWLKELKQYRKWLESFNPDSATECFTAVRQLRSVVKGMTREEKAKAIDALKISAPVRAMTQEEFNDYIQAINQIMDWLEQEPYKDTISRQAAIVQLSHNKIGDDDCDAIIQKDIETIKALPPVTPQPKMEVTR